MTLPAPRYSHRRGRLAHQKLPSYINSKPSLWPHSNSSVIRRGRARGSATAQKTKKKRSDINRTRYFGYTSHLKACKGKGKQDGGAWVAGCPVRGLCCGLRWCARGGFARTRAVAAAVRSACALRCGCGPYQCVPHCHWPVPAFMLHVALCRPGSSCRARVRTTMSYRYRPWHARTHTQPGCCRACSSSPGVLPAGPASDPPDLPRDALRRTMRWARSAPATARGSVPRREPLQPLQPKYFESSPE